MSPMRVRMLVGQFRLFAHSALYRIRSEILPNKDAAPRITDPDSRRAGVAREVNAGRYRQGGRRSYRALRVGLKELPVHFVRFFGRS